MRVLSRLRSIVQGKTEALLDGLEKPEEQLAVLVQELSDQMASLQNSVARAMADEKRFRRDIEDHLAKASEWADRAVLALENSDEDLAKEALIRKEEHERRASGYDVAWKCQHAATEKLKSQLYVSKERIEEARRKYTLMVAQYKTAQTAKRLNESLSDPSASSAIAMLERLDQKIRILEADTEATAELSDATTDGSLEASFAAIDRTRRGDAALDALKEKLATKVA